MLAFAASAAALPASAAALTVETVQLPGTNVSGSWFPRDIQPQADGNARVLQEQWGRGAQQRELLVGSKSLIGEPLQLMAPAATQGRLTSGSLTRSGAVVTFRSDRRPRPKLRAAIWEGREQVGKAQTLSDPSHSFRGGWTSASPNGAAAATFWQHLGGGVWEPRIAIRPAGASRFLPAVAATPTDQPVRRRTTGGEAQVIWGPNGDGMMLWSAGNVSGNSVVRRIQRDGTVGPAVRLPMALDSPSNGDAAVSVGPDGSITLVDASAEYGDWEPRGDDEDRLVSSRVQLVSIAAGSDTASAPVLVREVAGWSEEISDLTVGAEVGPEGHLIVAVAGGAKRIEIFEGADAASLQPVASQPNKDWAGYGEFSVLHTADGGAAVFWGAETMTMQRAAGGAWSAPQRLLPKLEVGISVLESPRALPDGGVVGILRRDSGKSDDVSLVPFVVRVHR
ncbi:MAG: hypothetical protein JHD16_18765 [Solirubrobacteraceae bacterium]|nr:hypothetical protein [Solirubrobacteraceae bacterium]